jgi:hypothetical protein
VKCWTCGNPLIEGRCPLCTQLKQRGDTCPHCQEKTPCIHFHSDHFCPVCNGRPCTCFVNRVDSKELERLTQENAKLKKALRKIALSGGRTLTQQGQIVEYDGKACAFIAKKALTADDQAKEETTP